MHTIIKSHEIEKETLFPRCKFCSSPLIRVNFWQTSKGMRNMWSGYKEKDYPLLVCQEILVATFFVLMGEARDTLEVFFDILRSAYTEFSYKRREDNYGEKGETK